MKRKPSAELSAPERKPRGRPFPPKTSGNPGGVSKEKRDFLERLTGEDAGEVYAGLMDLVRERNPAAVIRAWEYVVGKPKERVEVTGKDGGPLTTVQRIDVRKLSPSQLEAFSAALRATKEETT